MIFTALSTTSWRFNKTKIQKLVKYVIVKNQIVIQTLPNDNAAQEKLFELIYQYQFG
jgi:hypothetical protein